MNDLTAYYIIAFLPLIVTMIAQSYVKNAYSKYGKIPSSTGYTGAAVARDILDRNGMGSVEIKRMKGTLTDRYDPRDTSVYLSNGNHDSNSIAAIAVSAHECGHVLQHHEGYLPLNIRTALVPVANIGSKVGLPLVVVGLIIGYFKPLITIGIFLFFFAVLFQVVTLPVEFNASSRGLKLLETSGALGQEELAMSKKVLTAAALTYVAAAASSVMQLLRLLMLSGRGSRRRHY